MNTINRDTTLSDSLLSFWTWKCTWCHNDSKTLLDFIANVVDMYLSAIQKLTETSKFCRKVGKQFLEGFQGFQQLIIRNRKGVNLCSSHYEHGRKKNISVPGRNWNNDLLYIAQRNSLWTRSVARDRRPWVHFPLAT